MDKGALDSIFNLFSLVDQTKKVKREITNIDGTKEDDAQHMYMMAFMFVVMSSTFPTEANKLRVLELILVHDVVEILAGDTWYLTDTKGDKKIKEQAAAKEIFKEFPYLYDSWVEYEERITPESIIAKEFDIAQAVTSLILNEGADWQRNKITKKRETDFSKWIWEQDKPISNYIKYLFDIAEKKNLFYVEK